MVDGGWAHVSRVLSVSRKGIFGVTFLYCVRFFVSEE